MKRLELLLLLLLMILIFDMVVVCMTRQNCCHEAQPAHDIRPKFFVFQFSKLYVFNVRVIGCELISFNCMLIMIKKRSNVHFHCVWHDLAICFVQVKWFMFQTNDNEMRKQRIKFKLHFKNSSIRLQCAM